MLFLRSDEQGESKNDPVFAPIHELCTFSFYTVQHVLSFYTPYFSAYCIRDCRYRMSCVILLLMRDRAPFWVCWCCNLTIPYNGSVLLLFIALSFPLCPICIVALQQTLDYTLILGLTLFSII